MKKIKYLFSVILLAVMLAGCGNINTSTPLNRSSNSSETIPTSVKQAVIGRQDFSGELTGYTDWFNNLVGSTYKGRVITAIVSVHIAFAGGGYVTQAYALVSLGD
jgi:hypothetical protein